MDYTVVDDAMRARLPPSAYPVVMALRNDSDDELVVWLEMLPQQVVLGPGHCIELVARPTEGLLPLTMDYCGNATLQVHANEVADPDWHVRFNDHLIQLAYVTHLAHFEDIEGDVAAMRHPLKDGPPP
jgi:hypothetical protein